MVCATLTATGDGGECETVVSGELMVWERAPGHHGRYKAEDSWAPKDRNVGAEWVEWGVGKSVVLNMSRI
jgi:hypothetical protein